MFTIFHLYVHLNTALAVTRLIIYAKFFIVTRRNLFAYYYIWLPAIATWVQDSLTLYEYYVTSDDQNNDALMPYGIKELLYLRTLLIFFAIWRYTPYASFSQAVRSNKSTWWMPAIVISFYAVAAFVFDMQDVTLDHPFPWLNLSVVFCIVDSMLFFQAIYSVSAPDGIKNNPSFLMFGCLVTLLPLNTSLQAVIMLLHDFLFSAAWIALPLSILSYATLILETCLATHVITESRRDKIEWADLSSSDYNKEDRGYGTIV